MQSVDYQPEIETTVIGFFANVAFVPISGKPVAGLCRHWLHTVASMAPAPHGHSPPGPGHERNGQISKIPSPNTASVQLNGHSSGTARNPRGGRAISHSYIGSSPAETTPATAAEAAK